MSVVRFPRPAMLPPASDRFVVVEASAGTGKTFFLEHRVADLVLAGAELREILLVTFTDKAVAELGARIRDLLDRMARASESCDGPAWELDDAARARLRAAVTAFDLAPIFTIHGFCHRVLVEDAFAARRLLEQTQVADDVAFDDAFAALLRERFAKDAPDRVLLAHYLERGGTVDKLRNTLLTCARAGGMPRRRFDAARATELGGVLIAHLGTQDARDALAHSLPLRGRDATTVARWIGEIGEIVAELDGATDAVRVLAAVDELRDTASKILRKLPPCALATLLQDMLALCTLDEAIAGELLPHVIARIGRDKSERGLFDYDDMLQLVRDALHGPRGGELAARLRARTPWVMIDEFQDTDRVQWDIFRTVWCAEGARGLTIVGDPKQAIYGFRGADVATYLHARDELMRMGATPVTLDTNRRATDALVAATNALLAGPELGEPLIAHAPVRACSEVECDGTRPPITVFALHGPGRDDNRAALAGAIATEIEHLRAAPPIVRVRGEARPFSLAHCLVLTRANKESTAVADVLRARGLPCALVEPDRLFETREANELANVLAAIAAPRDRSARLRALRTRFFDVPWPELMHVVDAPDHHPAIARLHEWSALATRRAYESLFRELVEASRFCERALVLGGGERAIVNTWHLIELLLEAVARSRCDLHELVVQLRRWIADGDVAHPDDRDVQRVETDREAIRVLTIHKAKGLEAPFVFVFGCASGPRSTNVHALRDGAGRALVIGPADEAIEKQLEAENDAENRRLAYVALTRAQVRLYLPRYGGDRSLAHGAMYEPIQRCLVPLVTRNDPQFEVIDVPATPAGAPPMLPADSLAGLDAPAAPAVAPIAPIAGARAGLAIVSYTRLAHANVSDEHHEPVTVAEDELPPGAASGLLLHDLFESADLELVRTHDAAAWEALPATRELLAQCARARGVDARYLLHAARVVHATLASPLRLADGDQLPAPARAVQLAREVEFTFPLPGEPAPGLVRGFIDALLVHDDQLWVVDYKSDVLAGADLSRAAIDRVQERYAVQHKLYALAADRLRGARPLAGVVFAFVRHDIAVASRISDGQLAAWARWLAEQPTEVAR